MKYASFDKNGTRVFDFCHNNGYARVNLCNYKTGGKSRIGWGLYQGSNSKYLSEDSTCFDLAWTHVIVTVRGSTMRIYKNGALRAIETDAHEPETLTRQSHCIGSLRGNDYYLHGTVAYLRTWHGHSLIASDVQKLYSDRNNK